MTSKKMFIFSVYFSTERREDMLNDWEKRIVVDPKILVGKPVIRGTRLSVEFILGLLVQRLVNSAGAG